MLRSMPKLLNSLFNSTKAIKLNNIFAFSTKEIKK